MNLLTASAEFCVPKDFTPFYVLNFFIPEPLSWQAHVTCSSAKKIPSALGILPAASILSAGAVANSRSSDTFSR
jgi:hypothetical protein